MRRRVLVTDAGRGSSVAIIRSLGRAGWDVAAADSDVRSLGFRSRYAKWKVLYPPPETHAHDAARVIAETTKRLGVALVVPVTDDVILPLAAIRQEFDGVAVLAMPSDNALGIVADKAATLELAARLGVPVPQSRVVHDATEAKAAADDLAWPVVIKPPASRTLVAGGGIRRHEVRYACDAAELAAELAGVAKWPLLLQEYCAGEGHGVELLLREGRPLAAFQHRRLREVPVSGGASSYRESVPLDPILRHHSVALLASLQFTGLAMVEFRIGERGPMLMEINGRIWGSLPLAVKSGMDFPLLMASMYLGDAPSDKMLTRYRTGVRSRNLRLEVAWIRSILRGQRRHCLGQRSRLGAIPVALRLAWPPDGYDVLCADDPLPGLAELPNIIGDGLQRMRRRQ